MKFLGAFDTGDYILSLYRDGTYLLSEVTPTTKFDTEELLWVGRLQDDVVISAVYFDGEKEWTMVKRFQVETTGTGQRYKFISESKGSKLYFATADPNPEVRYAVKAGNKKNEHSFRPDEFIDVKGWKALGNKLTEYKIISIDAVHPEEGTSVAAVVEEVVDSKSKTPKVSKGQGSLFPDTDTVEGPKKSAPKKTGRNGRTEERKKGKKQVSKKAPAKKTSSKSKPAKTASSKKKSNPKRGGNGRLKAGDTIEFDL